MKTIVIDPRIHCQFLPDGRVEVLDFNHRFETTKRRVFKTAKNAAAKLRIDLKDALDCELEAGESGEYKWKGRPFPLNAALKELEDAK
jgi:hypothetical protein